MSLRAQAPAVPPQAEEPDFAFLTGGPYTQGEGVLQLIWASRYAADADRVADARVRSSAFAGALRVEWGFTDLLEGDIVAGFASESVRAEGDAGGSAQGLTDTLLGARYRFLHEDWAPFTLTAGPQLIVPTGDVDAGFGAGAVGYALDVAAAKDWGGPLFAYVSGNARWTPGVDDPTSGSSRAFTLRAFSYAAALGFRLLEEEGFPNGAQEDAHLFLEVGGAREDGLEEGALGGERRVSGPWEAAIGIRYGIFTREETFLEIGLAGVAGLNRAADDRAVILQIQWEGPLTQPTASPR